MSNIRLWVMVVLLTMLAIPAHATLRYVSLASNTPAGSDANAGTIAAPWLTFDYAMAHVSCGDTVYVRGGTYYIGLNTQTTPSVSCASFALAATMKGYPGETVHMRSIHVYAERYLIFEDLFLDGYTSGTGGDTLVIAGGYPGLNAGGGYIRLTNVDIHGNQTVPSYNNHGGPAVSGGLGSDLPVSWPMTGVGHNEMIGGKIHDGDWPSITLRPSAHCAYISSPYNLLDGVEMYHCGQYGVHNYQTTPDQEQPSHNTYRNMWIHDGGPPNNANFDAFCIGLITGTSNVAYNNVCARWDNGMQTGPTGTNNALYNNTIYGTYADDAYYAIDLEGTTPTAQNNLTYGNALNGVYSALAIGPTVDHNLSTNPSFVNTTGVYSSPSDFAIPTGSTARDTGTVIGTFSTDFAGQPRGATWDVGAFEFGTGAVYIAKTGTNSGSCGTLASPCLTIAYTVANRMSHGNHVYIRGGSYAEGIPLDTALAVVDGLTWATRTIFEAYAGETIILTSLGGCGTAGQPVNNIEFKGTNLNFQPGSVLISKCGDDTITGGPFKFDGILVNQFHASGFLDCMALDWGIADYSILVNSKLMNCSTPGSAGYPPPYNGAYVHGLYAEAAHLTVTDNEVVSTTGYCIHNNDTSHFGGPSYNTYERNVLHECGINNDLNAVFAVALNTGHDLTFRNNVIYDSANGISSGSGAGNNTIDHNTLYHIGTGGAVTCGSNCFPAIQSSTSDTLVRNNIIRSSQVNSISVTGSGASKSGNLESGDPLFANVAGSARDFSLQSGSPAINAVTCITTVTSDYVNVVRPQGASCDQGAYEYPSGAANQEPTSMISAPAVDTTIAAGGSVSFAGSGSDPDGNTPLTYLWTFGAGGPSNSTSQNPGAITFPTAGVYVVEFTVSDSLGLADSTPATVTITVGTVATGCSSGTDTFDNSGTPGSTWTRMNDATGATAVRVNGEMVTQGTLIDTLYYCNALSPTADQHAEVVMGAPGGSTYQGVVLRGAGTTAATFDGYVGQVTATTWNIDKFIDGVYSPLSSGSMTASVAGDVIRLTVIGSLLTLTRNGVTLGTYNGDTQLTSGLFGFALYSTGTATISSWTGANDGAATPGTPARIRVPHVR